MAEDLCGRCATCAHWGDLAFNTNHAYHETARICDLIVDINETVFAEPAWNGAEAFVTLPKFGCVHWTAKSDG